MPKGTEHFLEASDKASQSFFSSADAPSSPKKGKKGPRLALSLMVLFFAGMALFNTKTEFLWFLEGSTPLNVGDVRAIYRAEIEPPALRDNSFLAAENLIPSRRIPVTLEAASAGPSSEEKELEYIFYDPIMKVLVLTPQSIDEPSERMTRIPSVYKDLVAQKMIFPEDLSIAVNVKGRLRRADEAPRRLMPFADKLSERLSLPLEKMWVLEDGREPKEARWALWVYFLSILAAGFSLYSLIKSFIRK